ncbi:MAG TPA: DNA primase large subunit PriL [Methanocorpusculum sp.]|nr:DNA primase large subunit PriL [Methanocorpusculum sp.]
MPAVELRDLLHYPFLPEAQKVLASRGISVDSLTKTESGRGYLEKAASRVMFAIDGKELYPADNSGDNISDIITYVLARILVSCVKDRQTIQRFVKSEAKRVYQALSSEQNMPLKNRVCSEFGISVDTAKLSVVQYVEMCAGVRDGKKGERTPKWFLVNREITDGYVSVTPDELEILLCEKIKNHLSSSLPLAVPASLERDFQPWVEKITAKVQERTLETFGTVDESAFPPCIQALISAAAAGSNIIHAGRFALVAFLRRIGMDQDRIEAVFSSAVGYNAEMTEYQVNHILTHEYESMACPAMQTNGLCSHKNKQCEKVNHPLSYYRNAKKLAERKRQAEERRAAREAAAAEAKAKTAEAEAKENSVPVSADRNT